MYGKEYRSLTTDENSMKKVVAGMSAKEKQEVVEVLLLMEPKKESSSMSTDMTTCKPAKRMTNMELDTACISYHTKCAQKDPVNADACIAAAMHYWSHMDDPILDHCLETKSESLPEGVTSCIEEAVPLMEKEK